MTEPKKIFVKTFGCQMNVYDSERMTELLGADGFAATTQIEDADVTSAALALTQDGTQLQAAFKMRAKMPHNSLFDYLG